MSTIYADNSKGTSLFRQILPRSLGRERSLFVVIASAYSDAYADHRFLALLSKQTIGYCSSNSFLSPLFMQITVRVPRSLGRYYPALYSENARCLL